MVHTESVATTGHTIYYKYLMPPSDKQQSILAAAIADIMLDLNLRRSGGATNDSLDRSHWSPEDVLKITSSPDEHDKVAVAKQILSELLNSTAPRYEWEQVTTWKSFCDTVEAHKTDLVQYLGCLYSLRIHKKATDVPLNRLEILFHLASGLLQKRVQNNNAAIKCATKKFPAGKVQGFESNDSLAMPSQFTDQQRNLAHAYCEILKADYEQRLQGMRQRIAILSSSLLENSNESSSIPCKNVQLDNALNNLDCRMSRKAMIEQFCKPHSQTNSTALKKNNALQIQEKSIVVEDRGGRTNTDEKESRIYMPEWATERPIKSSPVKTPNKRKSKQSSHSKQ